MTSTLIFGSLMDFILCKKLDLFRYNKSTLNSMEKNILPRVRSLPLQTQLFFIRLLVISCLVYLLINRASLIRIHLSFSSYKFHPNKYVGRCFSVSFHLEFPSGWSRWPSCWKRSPGLATSPMDGMGYILSTFHCRKPLLFVRPMSSFSRWRHVQNFQQS